jgi:cupin superfamily acireductone dioxygenase involved in methionine salvage
LQYAGVVDKTGNVIKPFSKTQEKIYNKMNVYIANPTDETKGALLTSVKEVQQELTTFCKILERLQSQNEFHKIDIIKFFTKASKKRIGNKPTGK